MHLLRRSHRHRPSSTWAQRYLPVSASHPAASSNTLNYWGETDPFCLKRRLKDSSSQGCLLPFIRTSGLPSLPVPSTPNPQTSLVSNSALSSPYGDKEQRLKGSPWTDMTPRASVQRKAQLGEDPASRVWEVILNLQGCPMASWQATPAISEWHEPPSSCTSHGWSWELNAACQTCTYNFILPQATAS